MAALLFISNASTSLSFKMQNFIISRLKQTLTTCSQYSQIPQCKCNSLFTLQMLCFHFFLNAEITFFWDISRTLNHRFPVIHNFPSWNAQSDFFSTVRLWNNACSTCPGLVGTSAERVKVFPLCKWPRRWASQLKPQFDSIFRGESHRWAGQLVSQNNTKVFSSGLHRTKSFTPFWSFRNFLHHLSYLSRCKTSNSAFGFWIFIISKFLLFFI